MKKILFILSCLFLCSTHSIAEVIKAQGTSFAYATYNDNGYWNDWSDWQDCSVLVVINTDNDRVNIYSSTPQEYDIYDYDEEQYDPDGSSYVTFQCVDGEGLRCEMRLRIQANGQVQLYIDYADIMWVYNVEPK